MLRVESIDVYYGDVQAVGDVSLEVAPGEAVTLIGANGAGKSTVLKTICGLLAPRRGRIRLEGRDVTGFAAYELVARGL
ncbi:MAG TPA: ATP-binding cassette domain-containing protein, partial [Thermoanaerobaculia bacterium]|nr:ATP-binding cassette domain-containing protein [Thermoanaerobaculia bacterium]